MTFTCKCGVTLTAAPDPVLDADRDTRRTNDLLTQVGIHIQQKHGELVHPAFQMGLELTSFMPMLAILQTCDPAITAVMENSRQRLAAAISNPAGTAPIPGPRILRLAPRSNS